MSELSERPAPDPADGDVRVAPRAAPWGIIGALAFLALFQFFQGTVAILAPRGADRLAVTILAYACSGFITVSWGLVFIRGLAGGWNRAFGALGLRRPARGWPLQVFRVLSTGVTVWFIVFWAQSNILFTLDIRAEEVPAQELVRMIAVAQTPTMWLLTWLVTVVVAAVAEEFVMRGMLYQALRSRLGVVPGAVIVSVVFSAMHWYPWGAGNLFVLSIVLVALFERTRSLWVPMAAHALYNALMMSLIPFVFADT